MPGAYAHITLVNVLSEPAQLARLGFSKQGASAVSDYLGCCELGAVSPDYPYLAITNAKAAAWADLMHYQGTGDLVHAAVRGVRSLNGEEQRRVFSWLLGYSAHIAADVTIHPVVELKVGPYSENKKAHRVCEMHQDAYIFLKEMNLGDVGLSEHLDSGIARCTNSRDTGGSIDSAIREVWEDALKEVHPEQARSNPPDVGSWHTAFVRMVDNIAEEGNKLMPIARHVAANAGLTYPSADKIDHTNYIAQLEVPGGGKQHYDEIFARAKQNAGRIWACLDRTIFRDDPDTSFIGNWNLDTGRSEKNQLVFWS